MYLQRAENVKRNRLYVLEADQTFLICPGQVNMYTADETIMSKAQMLAEAQNTSNPTGRHYKP